MMRKVRVSRYILITTSSWTYLDEIVLASHSLNLVANGLDRFDGPRITLINHSPGLVYHLFNLIVAQLLLTKATYALQMNSRDLLSDTGDMKICFVLVSIPSQRHFLLVSGLIIEYSHN